MEGRWLEGGSVVSWAGLLAVRQVEEGATNEDLDLDDDGRRGTKTMTVTRTMDNDGYRWIPMDSDR